MSRRSLAFLLGAVTLLAGVLGASSLGAPATASAAPPQCLTNLVGVCSRGTGRCCRPRHVVDPDHDALTIILVSGPSHGTLTAQAARWRTHLTADALYEGSESSSFKVNDGSSGSAVSTLTINVQPPPNGTQDLAPPVAEPSHRPPTPSIPAGVFAAGHGISRTG